VKTFEKYNIVWRQNAELLDVIGVAVRGAEMWIVTVTTLIFISDGAMQHVSA
jgi:hypothetical protein